MDGRKPRPPGSAASQRRAAPGERESPGGAREQEQDAHTQGLGAFEALEQRTRATIERSRALLAASSHRHDRPEAAAGAEGRRERHQAEARPAEGARLAARPPGPGSPVERAKALRSQALAAIAAFAETEEEIARLHDELAARHPGRRDEHRKLAGHARAAARKAQEIMRDFSN